MTLSDRIGPLTKPKPDYAEADIRPVTKSERLVELLTINLLKEIKAHSEKKVVELYKQ